MAARKQDVFDLCEKHGIEVDHETGAPAYLTLWAPPGRIFATSGCHVDCSVQSEGGPMAWPRAYHEIEVIIGYGFPDCPEGASCDVCNP